MQPLIKKVPLSGNRFSPFFVFFVVTLILLAGRWFVDAYAFDRQQSIDDGKWVEYFGTHWSTWVTGLGEKYILPWMDWIWCFYLVFLVTYCLTAVKFTTKKVLLVVVSLLPTVVLFAYDHKQVLWWATYLNMIALATVLPAANIFFGRNLNTLEETINKAEERSKLYIWIAAINILSIVGLVYICTLRGGSDDDQKFVIIFCLTIGLCAATFFYRSKLNWLNRGILVFYTLLLMFGNIDTSGILVDILPPMLIIAVIAFYIRRKMNRDNEAKTMDDDEEEGETQEPAPIMKGLPQSKQKKLT